MRKRGMLYSEICQTLDICIPKSTLSGWFEDIKISEKGLERLESVNRNNLYEKQKMVVEANRKRREKYLKSLTEINLKVCSEIHNPDTAKIALAMLCLGDGSKYSPSKSFSFGNSNPQIINTFLILLDRSFGLETGKLRATVQCRADQDSQKLQEYWVRVTGIPISNFYKPRIDKRTIGKPTRKLCYKGVLRIDYFSSKAQLELEDLARLVYNELCENLGR